MKVEGKIPIPAGYRLIAVASYGRFIESRTYYCQEIGTHKVVTCNDGSVGDEISIPEGYSLVGVSAYGDTVATFNFFAKKTAHMKFTNVNLKNSNNHTAESE